MPDEQREFLTEMFGQIAERFDAVDARFDDMEKGVNARFDKLEEKVDGVVRVNGVLIDSVADVNRRLGNVETRLGDIEGKLP